MPKSTLAMIKRISRGATTANSNAAEAETSFAKEPSKRAGLAVFDLKSFRMKHSSLERGCGSVADGLRGETGAVQRYIRASGERNRIGDDLRAAESGIGRAGKGESAL